MNNLTEYQKKVLKWGAWVAIVAVLAFTGMRYPLPGDFPDFPDEVPIALGTTHFTNLEAEDITATDDLAVTDDTSIGGDLDVTGTTTWGITSPTLSDNLTLTGTLTAEDAVITDTLDVNGDIDLDGDGFDVNITAGFSVDGDAASNINVAGAGIDLTLESEAGRVVIKGDEAAANGVHIDANDAAGTGLTIDVGATGGVLISGGPTDIGGGTCATATGDNDLCVADALEVDGAIDADGTLIVDGAVTFVSTADIRGNISSTTGAVTVTDAVLITSTLTVSDAITFENGSTLDESTDGILTFSEFVGGAEQTAEVVTAGSVISITGTFQPISSASAVTCSTTECIQPGTQDMQVLVLQNVNASDTITIDGTGGGVECKSDVVLGSYDTIMLLWNNSNWYCLSVYDNS